MKKQYSSYKYFLKNKNEIKGKGGNFHLIEGVIFSKGCFSEGKYTGSKVAIANSPLGGNLPGDNLIGGLSRGATFQGGFVPPQIKRWDFQQRLRKLRCVFFFGHVCLSSTCLEKLLGCRTIYYWCKSFSTHPRNAAVSVS